MIEMMRQIQPALVTGVCVELRQHFHHAAKLCVEHPLSLGFVELEQNPFRPGRELDLDIQRGAIAGVTISISQPGERFVQSVPRRPETVQVKEARANIATGHLVELFSASLQSAEIAVAI